MADSDEGEDVKPDVKDLIKHKVTPKHSAVKEVKKEVKEEPKEVKEEAVEDEDREECSICFMAIHNIFSVTSCGHRFHSICLQKWFSAICNCPLCRTEVEYVEEHRNGKVERKNIEKPARNGNESEDQEADAYWHIHCQVCQQNHSEEQLLLCDQCDCGYHLFCLNPPLAEVPAGNWYCPVCAPNRPAPPAQPSRRRRVLSGQEQARRRLTRSTLAQTVRQHVQELIHGFENESDEEEDDGSEADGPVNDEDGFIVDDSEEEEEVVEQSAESDNNVFSDDEVMRADDDVPDDGRPVPSVTRRKRRTKKTTKRKGSRKRTTKKRKSTARTTTTKKRRGRKRTTKKAKASLLEELFGVRETADEKKIRKTFDSGGKLSVNGASYFPIVGDTYEEIPCSSRVHERSKPPTEVPSTKTKKQTNPCDLLGSILSEQSKTFCPGKYWKITGDQLETHDEYKKYKHRVETRMDPTIRGKLGITVEEGEVVSATATPEEPGKDKSPRLKESGKKEAGNGNYSESHRSPKRELYGSRRDSSSNHHNDTGRNHRENDAGRNGPRPRVYNELDKAIALRNRASTSQNENKSERRQTSDHREDRERLRDREPRRTDSSRDIRRDVHERERRPEYEERRHSDADRERRPRERGVHMDREKDPRRDLDRDRRDESGRRSGGDHERRGRREDERDRNRRRDEKEREERKSRHSTEDGHRSRDERDARSRDSQRTRESDKDREKETHREERRVQENASTSPDNGSKRERKKSKSDKTEKRKEKKAEKFTIFGRPISETLKELRKEGSEGSPSSKNGSSSNDQPAEQQEPVYSDNEIKSPDKPYDTCDAPRSPSPGGAYDDEDAYMDLAYDDPIVDRVHTDTPASPDDPLDQGLGVRLSTEQPLDTSDLPPLGELDEDGSEESAPLDPKLEGMKGLICWGKVDPSSAHPEQSTSGQESPKNRRAENREKYMPKINAIAKKVFIKYFELKAINKDTYKRFMRECVKFCLKFNVVHTGEIVKKANQILRDNGLSTRLHRYH